MTKEEFIRNLKYTMKKHENDKVPTFGTNIYVMCKDILDYLEQEPCTSTQKTGHWIFDDRAHEHAHCSECGYGSVDLFNGRPHNYCPNCGAKMNEDKRTLEYSDQDTLMSAT